MAFQGGVLAITFAFDRIIVLAAGHDALLRLGTTDGLAVLFCALCFLCMGIRQPGGQGKRDDRRAESQSGSHSGLLGSPKARTRRDPSPYAV